jgi:hypothetical protein
MTLKDQIWEAHPYMPRVKKLKLIRHLDESYEQIQVICKHLGLPPPNAYDPPKCDIADDFLIIRDKDNQTIANVYIGQERTKIGLIVFPNGSMVTEHKYHLIQGHLPNDDGYIDQCRCADCQQALLVQHEQIDKERIQVYADRVEKIRSASDRLPLTVDAPRNIPPKPVIMKITTPTHNGFRSTDPS